jgi:hypothetical protein
MRSAADTNAYARRRDPDMSFVIGASRRSQVVWIATLQAPDRGRLFR